MRVRFHSATTTEWSDAETRNIGVGGAFIVTQTIAEVGATITIQMSLPTSDQTFSLPAVVRWATTDGMGLQFVGVDVDILLELNDYFATLVGG